MKFTSLQPVFEIPAVVVYFVADHPASRISIFINQAAVPLNPVDQAAQVSPIRRPGFGGEGGSRREEQYEARYSCSNEIHFDSSLAMVGKLRVANTVLGTYLLSMREV
jgi:hypothetical protein